MPIAAAARHIKWVLFITQAFGSAGFLVASTVTPIVGADLARRASWAGVPTACYWAGGALFATVWGRLMDPLGRRMTMTLGLSTGVVGAVVAAGAIALRSFLGFVTGLLLMGAANAAMQLGRFVAGEVHQPAARGRAIATVVMGGTVGAVLGPVLVAPMSALALSLGGPGLSGPYAASAAFFVLGGAVVAALLRPEPRDLALRLAQPAGPAPAARPLATILADSTVAVTIAAMVASQAVMTMLMVITSLEMSHRDHGLEAISGVMSAHVLGMFGFSLISGRLADRWGRGPLIAFGGAMLICSGVVASRAIAVIPLGAALWLLGLGWNVVYVGGSTLLSDRLAAAERAKVQGLNDSLVTATAAGASVVSGVVFSAVGYGVMGVVCAATGLIPFVVGRWLSRARQPLDPAVPPQPAPS
ncbi:MAG: MFS transporter [Gemmatimonadetes bacterium]|nr:MFS transporter [Gemmatimonadota bacterium]